MDCCALVKEVWDGAVFIPMKVHRQTIGLAKGGMSYSDSNRLFKGRFPVDGILHCASLQAKAIRLATELPEGQVLLLTC